MNKKVIKRSLVVVSGFVLMLYFMGSCSHRVPIKHTDLVPRVYTEVPLDEYEKHLNDEMKHTSLSYKPLEAYAGVSDTLDNWFDKTNLYDVYDFTKGYFDYLKNPDYYPEDDNNIPPPVNTSKEDSPVTSAIIPYHYNAYGKERVNYNNGVYEIVVCRFDADLSINSSPAKGHITFTRNSSAGYSTSFGFDVKLFSVSQSFNSNTGFSFNYTVLDTNVSGIDTISTDWKNINGKAVRVYFDSSLTNNIHTTTYISNTVASISAFVSSNTSTNSQNRFTVSQTFSNDYTFNTSLNDYQNSGRTKSVNVYYNNHAMDVVTTNNYNNYSEYGYTYNSVTGSLELNPNVIADFFDTSIKPQLDLKFDDLFSVMPDIDATIKDYTGETNNLVEVIQQSTSTATTPAGTYPVATGDINIEFNVTFPEEYYKKYPAFTTTPSYKVNEPDLDFAFGEKLPNETLSVAGKFLNGANNLVHESGLFPFVLFSVSVGLISILI